MDISQEYFDKKIEQLASKSDLESLKTYSDEQTEKLAAMIADGFEEIRDQLDVKSEVAQLKKDMIKIKEALHIQ